MDFRTIGDWLGSAPHNSSLFLSVGLLLVFISAVRLWRGDPRGDRPVALDEMRRIKYTTWGLLPAADEPALVGQLERYWRRLAVTTGFAAGITTLLAAAAFAVLDRIDTPLLAARTWPWAWQSLLYLALMVGTGVGYPLAMSVSRRRGPTGPRYADLRERRLADYRTPVLRWVGLAIVAVPCVAALLAGQGWWPALVVPAEMALAFVVTEALMALTATAPRTVVVTTDAAIARRCDDLIRAQVITSLQMSGFFAIAVAGFLQWLVILGARHVESPAAVLTLLGAALALLMGLFAPANDCRLGGRINGWPGRPMPE